MPSRARTVGLIGAVGLVVAAGLGGCEPSSTQASQAAEREKDATRERNDGVDRYLEQLRQERAVRASAAPKPDWSSATAPLDATPHDEASPEDVARSLVIYMARRDADRSFALLSSGAVARLEGLVRDAEAQIRALGLGDPRHAPFTDAASVWRALVAQGRVSGSPADLEAVATIDGDTASVRLLHRGTGEAQTIRAVREGGAWRLDLSDRVRLMTPGSPRGGRGVSPGP